MTSTKKIKCLIIDDEPPAQVVLKKYIEQVSSLELAGVCNNAVEAISFLQNQSVRSAIPRYTNAWITRNKIHPNDEQSTKGDLHYCLQKICSGGI